MGKDTDGGKPVKHAGSRVFLFCGLPGTLKTTLATRLAGKLGYAYVPTAVAGGVSGTWDPANLEKVRRARYGKCGEIASFMTELGAGVVIDGGFGTEGDRLRGVGVIPASRVVVVHCRCGDPHLRRQRLAARAADPLDLEAESARVLLESDCRIDIAEPPVYRRANDSWAGVLEVDTVAGTSSWAGRRGDASAKVAQSVIETALKAISVVPVERHSDRVMESFEELASTYENTTEWRADQILLSHIRESLGSRPARVLDLGAGTGLASAWYAEQGHYAVGLDFSPRMLQRAADRLTLVVLGSVLAPPFLPEYFDLAIARQCLHYVDPMTLLKQAYRVLRPGGQIVVGSVVCSDERARLFWRELRAATQPLRLEVFTRDRICNLLKAAGFAVTQVREHSLTRRQSLEELAARVPEPEGGWQSFLRTTVALGARESPSSEMSFDERLKALDYRQEWVAVWGIKS